MKLFKSIVPILLPALLFLCIAGVARILNSINTADRLEIKNAKLVSDISTLKSENKRLLDEKHDRELEAILNPPCFVSKDEDIADSLFIHCKTEKDAELLNEYFGRSEFATVFYHSFESDVTLMFYQNSPLHSQSTESSSVNREKWSGSSIRSQRSERRIYGLYDAGD